MKNTLKNNYNHNLKQSLKLVAAIFSETRQCITCCFFTIYLKKILKINFNKKQDKHTHTNLLYKSRRYKWRSAVDFSPSQTPSIIDSKFLISSDVDVIPLLKGSDFVKFFNFIFKV